jgi:hypothetical protein
MLREHADDQSGQLISPEAERLQSAARLDELRWENASRGANHTSALTWSTSGSSRTDALQGSLAPQHAYIS